MHRYCAEFHALLACGHKKRPGFYMRPGSWERQIVFFLESEYWHQSAFSHDLKVGDIHNNDIEDKFLRSIKTVLTTYNTYMQWYFWGIRRFYFLQNLKLHVRTNSKSNGFKSYFLLIRHDIPEVPWRVMTPKVPSANNCLATVGGPLLSWRKNDY